MSMTSQNRWPVYTSGSHRDLVVHPRITGRIRGGPAAIILGYVADQFHARVESVIRGHSWGYAYRAIRGRTSGYSNHASATAIDLNAPAHPLGARGTFTSAQVREIRKILSEVGGIVRWGGDYNVRKDEMHFEINVSPWDSRLTPAARRLTGLPGAGANPPNPSPEEDDMLTPTESAMLKQIFEATAVREGIERQGESSARQTVNFPIHRGGKPVPMIVEIAGTKTDTNSILSELAALRAAVAGLSKAGTVNMAEVQAAAKRASDESNKALESKLAELVESMEMEIRLSIGAALGQTPEQEKEAIIEATLDELVTRVQGR